MTFILHIAHRIAWNNYISILQNCSTRQYDNKFLNAASILIFIPADQAYMNGKKNNIFTRWELLQSYLGSYAQGRKFTRTYIYAFLSRQPLDFAYNSGCVTLWLDGLIDNFEMLFCIHLKSKPGKCFFYCIANWIYLCTIQAFLNKHV